MLRERLNAIILTASLAALAAACASQPASIQPATLVLTNGKVVTVEPNPAEARAVAITGHRITAVGSEDEIKKYIGTGTQVIDAGGQLVIPGFIESHGHFQGVGEAQLVLKLATANTWDDILAMVENAAKAAKPGQWIYGRGWHQEKWSTPPSPSVEGFPTEASLSKVSPDNPVLLTHASGHASFANALAMKLSGISRSTKNPEGGEILKDARGNPTGLLRETASRLVKRGLGEPAPTDDERRERENRVLQLAAEEALAKGITSFQDAGTSFETIDRMKALVDEDKLGVRLWIMVRAGVKQEAQKLAQYRMIDYHNGFLTVRAIKRSIDGALGSRGAWLLEPYADKPDSTGLNTTPLDELRDVADLAMQHDYQLCVHAIGDRANRETLNIFEEAFKTDREKKDLRWRVEHAQHLHPSDIPRFNALGVIASMEGVHCTSDAPYVLARLGPKRAEEGAYVWQKLMKSGAVVTNGTDAPVEDVDPIASYYATVSRKLKDGSVFYPDQRMSRMEALRSYTINGAFAAFEEGSKGTLAPGKYADMVVLSKDILSVPEDEIPTARVAYTIVGGKVRYKR